MMNARIFCISIPFLGKATVRIAECSRFIRKVPNFSSQNYLMYSKIEKPNFFDEVQMACGKLLL
jgi:hypothetical protein